MQSGVNAMLGMLVFIPVLFLTTESKAVGSPVHVEDEYGR
jgi:hypothetical protein